MYPFEKLEVWKLSRSIAVDLLRDFGSGSDPRVRLLADQAWRAACSIPANIAEGSASSSKAQFARYLTLALGSANELETHIRVARDAGLMTRAVADARLPAVIRVKKMLWSLRERVRRGSGDDGSENKQGGHQPPTN